MASESRQDKIAELASTIDEVKVAVDELAEDSVSEANVTQLNELGTALERASDVADDLVEGERDEDS